MLMVIFGAGASHGCRPPPPDAFAQGYETLRPPVTAQLFTEQYARHTNDYPASRPAIVGLRRALERDPELLLEAELGRLYEEAATYPERARHLLALRYYLWAVIDDTATSWWNAWNGITHYAELLQVVGSWRHRNDEPVALVTFNYDELLDRSCSAQVAAWRVGQDADFDTYVTRDDWRLYKLHGSTTWSRLVPFHMAIDTANPVELIARAEHLDTSQGRLRPAPWRQWHEADEVAIPGLAVPTNRKQTFECPPDHVEHFKRDAEHVDRLLLIGWRAAEPHALEILKRIERGLHLMIVDWDDEALDKIRDNLGDVYHYAPEPWLIREGFGALLHGSTLENWLDLPKPGTIEH